jgi:hypothetical protein
LLCNLVAEHGGAGMVFSQPSDGIIGSKVDWGMLLQLLICTFTKIA